MCWQAQENYKPAFRNLGGGLLRRATGELMLTACAGAVFATGRSYGVNCGSRRRSIGVLP